MTLVPRAVVVSRATELEEVLAAHATRGQAAFFLRERGRDIAEVEERHRQHEKALATVSGSIPVEWRRAEVRRVELDRFLFEPEDVVITVGPDGLVANVAKYLDGQPVIGVGVGDRGVGVLADHRAEDVATTLFALRSGGAVIEDRTMVEVETASGLRLRALNELYVGHRSHQSARYVLSCPSGVERQSSSGVIVSTGTGGTGWAASIARERGAAPSAWPEEPEVEFFVREAWPGPGYGVDHTQGLLAEARELVITSEMEDGVVFGDGVEADALPVGWGEVVRVRVSETRLRLVRAD